MLPTETFADAVSFLGYYDLGGLKLTNKLFSAVANRCASAIRLFDFSDLKFCVWGSRILVYPLGSSDPGTRVCTLELVNTENLAEFIPEAFRNCAVGHISFSLPRAIVRNAMKGVANSIAVTQLDICAGLFENTQDFIEFVDSFRRVENLMVLRSRSRALSLDDKASIKTFCQRKNIALPSYF